MSSQQISKPMDAQEHETWSADRGILDLYTRRMAAVAEAEQLERVRTIDQHVITKPFGRPFTAQPSYPPDPAADPASAMAALRRRLVPSPSRKLATS